MRWLSTSFCTSLLALGLTVGCGGSQGSSSTGGEPGAASAQNSGHLTISAMQIVESSSGQSIRLWADGRVQVGDRAVGFLYADGRFVTRSGHVIARLESDGRVSWHGDSEPRDSFQISERGEVKRNGELLASVDGAGLVTLSTGGGAEQELELDGPSEGRRAALFVALVASARGEAEKPAGEGSTTAEVGEATAESEATAEVEAGGEVAVEAGGEDSASAEVSVEASGEDSASAEGDGSGDAPEPGEDEGEAGEGGAAEVGVDVEGNVGGESEPDP